MNQEDRENLASLQQFVKERKNIISLILIY